jgi:hypothetical protein
VLPKFKPSTAGSASEFIEIVLVHRADSKTDLFGVAGTAFAFGFEHLLGKGYLFEDFFLILGVDFENKPAVSGLVLSFHGTCASFETHVEK